MLRFASASENPFCVCAGETIPPADETLFFLVRDLCYAAQMCRSAVATGARFHIIVSSTLTTQSWPSLACVRPG